MRLGGTVVVVLTLASSAPARPAAPAEAAAPEPGASEGSAHGTPRDGGTDRAPLSAFLRDTSLALRLRSHYVGVRAATGAEREAWALGGWLAYRSGWLLDALQAGATFYGSAPAWAPADKGETLLLAPGREGYHVLGEAFLALRYRGYAAIRAYRQALDEPWVNRQDNAMTPNTFEGVTVGGRIGPVEHAAGYLARMKARNADRFVPMSEAAGARGSDGGVALVRVTMEPLRGLSVTASEQYGIDTFNTLFLLVEHGWPAGRGVRLQLGVQLTDQRAVGDALVARTRAERWETRNASARAVATWRGLTLRIAGSLTASGNRIQSPWGFSPGYLRMDQQLFNDAREKAWLVGVDCDFAAVAPGLTAFARAGRGVDAIDPVTRAPLGDEAEYDLVVAYRPPAIEGLLFRARGLRYEREGAERVGTTLRFTVNWEIPVLRPASPRAGRAGRGKAEAAREGREAGVGS